jgi:hypothetical protein
MSPDLLLADPEEVIMTKRPGSAIFAKVNVGVGWEVAFMVREESARIPYLGRQVVLRTGLLEQRGVGLIPILFRLGPEDQDVFETWLNFHAPDKFGRKNDHLEVLTKQGRILILFYGERGRERNIMIRNSAQQGFKDILQTVHRLPVWSMQEFDNARSEVYAMLPTVKALWQQFKFRESVPGA